MYVHFLDKNRQPETYERLDWANKSKYYIAEPEKDEAGNAQPNDSRLVDYVEYAICAKNDLNPLLPFNSIAVDLPGGGASDPGHIAILEKELASADAILLIAGVSLDSVLVKPIFEKVRDEVVNKKPEIASEMIFLVATHWDKANSQENMNNAVGAWKVLMQAMPPDYAEKHKENPYYRIRALDAFFATMYILGKENEPQAGSDKQKREYLSRVSNHYEELRSSPGYQDLPAISNPTEITKRHHEAMLELSNLPLLERDLQKFLAESRFTIQLVKAKAELRRALELLSTFAWTQVRRFHPHLNEDLDELVQAENSKQSQRVEAYKDEIKSRTEKMKDAWKQAVQASLDSLREPENSFLKSLNEAHRQANRWVEQRIDAGDFLGPRYFITNERTIDDVPKLGTDKVSEKVNTKELLAALRTRFWLAIEHEMCISNPNNGSPSPTEALAQTFLAPLERQEQPKAPLDIDSVSEGEIGRNSALQKQYNRIKQDVRSKAREVCLSLTMTALLYHSNALDDQNESVGKLDTDKTTDKKILVKNVLSEMVKNIVSDTQSIITLRFHYELSKLSFYDAITDTGKIDHHDGDFIKLTDEIHYFMRDLLKEERVLQKFNGHFAVQDEEIAYWQSLLTEVKSISRGRGALEA